MPHNLDTLFAPSPTPTELRANALGRSREPTSSHASAYESRLSEAVLKAPLSEYSEYTEIPMEQVKTYVCAQCASPVDKGHKFCGRCGAPVPESVLARKVDPLSAFQAQGVARLSVIRGQKPFEGMSFMLNGGEHIAGRDTGSIVFPTDRCLSPRHARFFYVGERLFVKDEKSVNGAYLRIRQPTTLNVGDHFLCGEQVFRIEQTPKDDSAPAPDGTFFYASPKRPSPFRLVQVLRGGGAGMVYCARENSVQIGRDDSDMNFPEDIYMSAHHARIEMGNHGQFVLTDQGSKNGTYVRIREEAELNNGDYLFLGKQLLRVEISSGA